MKCKSRLYKETLFVMSKPQCVGNFKKTLSISVVFEEFIHTDMIFH